MGMVPSQGGMADMMVQISIIANNGFGMNCGDVSGIVFAGKNIVGDSSCGSSSGGLIVADPLLAPLANNGGPTPDDQLRPSKSCTQRNAGLHGHRRSALHATRCDLRHRCVRVHGFHHRDAHGRRERSHFPRRRSPGTAVAALNGDLFATGQASAAARTNNTPVWVAPANTSRTIKLVRPPRR